MKRVLALLFAAGLVVGAVFLRKSFDDDGATSSSGDDGGAGTPTLVCATEVRAACEQLEDNGHARIVAVEAAGNTTDRLAADGELGADAWLTASFWPEIAADARTRAQLDGGDLADTSDALATADVVMALASNQADAIDSGCGGAGEANWACVGEQAGSAPYRVGIDSADDTSGLTVVATALASEVGEIPPRPEDLSDEQSDWFRHFAANLTQGRPGLTALETLQTFRGQFDLAGGLATDVVGTPDVRTPAPTAQVAVVVAGHPDRIDLTAVRDALDDTGWDTSGTPAPEGLPKSGVMEALRSAWKAEVS